MDSHEKLSRVKFGPFQADLRSGELHCEGKKVHLQDQPFHVLSVLLKRAGELVTREELRTQVWPSNTFLEFDYALNTAIKKIRIALSDDAVAPRYVQTIPKRGYRWIAPALFLDECEDAPAIHPPTALASKMRALALGLLLGVVLSSFGLRGVPGPANDPLVLTVGPVQNGTGDQSLDLLCEGISRHLTAYLVQSEISPRITSPPVQPAVPGTRPTLAARAEGKFNVQYAVESSLRALEQRVHIDVVLSRSRDHVRIWAGSFEHAPGNPLQVEADLAREISTQVIGALRTIQPAGTGLGATPPGPQTAVQ